MTYPTSHQPAHKCSRGFTLIEMLVVITIIIILASLLQPGIQNALERGRLAGCMSNLRQQGIAVMAFAAENNQSLPTHQSRPASGHNRWGHENIGWEQALIRYLDDSEPGDANEATGNAAFICPSSSIRWNSGTRRYLHRGVVSGASSNAYSGLYYNYQASPLNTDRANPNPSLLRMNFYARPSSQPLQWCSQRFSTDPTIPYNTNTLAALSWHPRGRPTLFMDGSALLLTRSIHNTLGEQVMVRANHPDNINHSAEMGVWGNAGAFSLRLREEL
ncbi:MAG: prepilin-type N-terminal cleavage/methylation domain-containing protein [Verrucomicrobia bacterium]|nr:prepilin-type N-terminal cleavage/methylation domain-containing protein [Verrucomicrobiota bacterium]MCH8527416.1 prepilin-type N-terminal cleavage/methylation domain-containing protein [Kiritimatiellia bacterium]